MAIRMRVFALMVAISLPMVHPSEASNVVVPEKVQNDTLRELDRQADELSESARRTIEEFVNLVGPMLNRLSRLIDNLPTYETPEILPNGDIIIRRKPDAPTPSRDDDDGLTET